MASSSERAVRRPHQSGGNNIDLSITTALHALFGSSIALFVSLVALKFLGSTENPFETKWLPMMLFIFFLHLYFMAILSEIRNSAEYGAVNITNFFRIVYVVSGVIILEILGFIICGPYVLIVMNPAVFFLVEVLLFMFKRLVPNVPEENVTENPLDAPEETPTAIPTVPKESPTTNPNDLESGDMELKMEFELAASKPPKP